ncbi:hypothetical protein HU200_001888 [Digitaria exilis]|uniref:AP2/ERF domain-containing protein n=1 Tax=Digitaria exilis TaxID=1010633 RepID=A0A835KUI4_9POAL|nr:hypothetical protein HU200_001888 [Digitaria exilis]
MEHEQPDGGTPLPGRRVRADTRHPVYRGIRYRGGKWVSEIREPGKSNRIWLGTYATPEMAAAAYDAAALALRGAEAALNFPGAAAARPAPASSSPDDIRAAAASAAAAMVGPGGGQCAGHYSHLPQQPAGESCGSEAAAGASSEQRAGESRRIVDEDEVFQMPRLLEGMAEGLMMSPPRLSPTADGADGAQEEEEDDNDGGMSLWDHT